MGRRAPGSSPRRPVVGQRLARDARVLRVGLPGVAPQEREALRRRRVPQT